MKPWIGVLGYPLTHSLSKQIHEEKLKKANLPYDFRVLEWHHKDIDQHLRKLKQDFTCLGFSVTMPYKEKIISYLDQCEGFARQVSSVNCVKNMEGQWMGYNTDAHGFMEHLRCWKPLPPKDVHVVILGKGATARVLHYVLTQEGYENFIFMNRGEIESQKWPALIPRENIFILNATPLGMNGEKIDVIPMSNLRPPVWIFDIIYNPSQTPFIAEAQKRCFYTMNGWPMFQKQADLAFQIWNF